MDIECTSVIHQLNAPWGLFLNLCTINSISQSLTTWMSLSHLILGRDHAINMIWSIYTLYEYMPWQWMIHEVRKHWNNIHDFKYITNWPATSAFKFKLDWTVQTMNYTFLHAFQTLDLKPFHETTNQKYMYFEIND